MGGCKCNTWYERGSLAPPDAIMNRVNMLIDLMKKERLDGKPLIEHPIYRDRLMKIKGKLWPPSLML